jgi:hypothetical protein
VVKEIISLLMRKVERILIMPNDSYCVTTMVDFGTKILELPHLSPIKGIIIKIPTRFWF